jgi:zinc protease
MNAIQFLHHPYGEPLIGWLNEMQKLTREDAEAFYQRFYTPTDAILIVAGDVNGPEVLALAKKYYGVLPRRDVAPSERVQEPPPIAPRSVALTHSDVGQPMWRRSYLAPSAHKGDTKLAPALEVLSEYLGGGTLSQLDQSLVVNQKIAAGAGGFYTAEQKDLSTFDVYAVPVTGQSLDAIQDAVDAEIARVRAGDIDKAAVERAKTLLKASVIYSRDNIMSMMQIYGTVITAGLPLSYVTDWEKTIDAVTVDDMVAAANAVLRPERSVTGRLLPASPNGGGGEPQAVLQPAAEQAEH